MTYREVVESLREAGYDDATIKSLLANESAASKQAKLVQQAEYDKLMSQAADLEMAMNGTKDKPGARAYQDWYQKNYPEIQKLDARVKAFEAKYGSLEDPKNMDTTPPAGGKTFSEAEVAALVDKRILEGYSQRWSNLMEGGLTIADMHRNHKVPLDTKRVTELANIKHNGDLVAAYKEWIEPEVQKQKEADAEREVEKRVQARLDTERKKNAGSFFPAAADASSGESKGLTKRQETSTATKDAPKPVYDRNKVIESAITGEYAPKEAVH